jgi:hypothetical protein
MKDWANQADVGNLVLQSAVMGGVTGAVLGGLPAATWQYPNLKECKFVSKKAFHSHVD